jgi:epoxide hydrolase-like predicted phosphatase
VPIEAVVFDIGGVLEINPRTGWPRRWAVRLGMEVADFERRLDAIWAPGSVGTARLEAIERQTALAFGLDQAAVNSLMDDAWSEYVGSLNHDLAAYFANLRPRYRTGILSNSFVGAREREQEAHGFREMCDVIVYSHEEGYLKPDPRIYRIACSRLGVAPQSAVLLDDVQQNVDGALAVGMNAITFVDNTQAIADLEVLLSCD